MILGRIAVALIIFAAYMWTYWLQNTDFAKECYGFVALVAVVASFTNAIMMIGCLMRLGWL